MISREIAKITIISRNFFTDTIPRAVDCDRQTAIGLTTLVDRNGRCIGKKFEFPAKKNLNFAAKISIFFFSVKCAGYAICKEVQKTVERTSSRRGGRALKV